MMVRVTNIGDMNEIYNCIFINYCVLDIEQKIKYSFVENTALRLR